MLSRYHLSQVVRFLLPGSQVQNDFLQSASWDHTGIKRQNLRQGVAWCRECYSVPPGYSLQEEGSNCLECCLMLTQKEVSLQDFLCVEKEHPKSKALVRSSLHLTIAPYTGTEVQTSCFNSWQWNPVLHALWDWIKPQLHVSQFNPFPTLIP